mmetsp:Transcript_121575/g.330290  ORF Transcript_121575/g.330290 Transcript_121575/m.330290 type:complete len:256 (+) Transcript_121575:1237-2004(+)
MLLTTSSSTNISSVHSSSTALANTSHKSADESSASWAACARPAGSSIVVRSASAPPSPSEISVVMFAAMAAPSQGSSASVARASCTASFTASSGAGLAGSSRRPQSTPRTAARTTQTACLLGDAQFGDRGARYASLASLASWFAWKSFCSFIIRICLFSWSSYSCSNRCGFAAVLRAPFVTGLRICASRSSAALLILSSLSLFASASAYICSCLASPARPAGGALRCSSSISRASRASFSCLLFSWTWIRRWCSS